MNLIVQWFSMGGYAAYVWSAYGLVLGMLALNLIHTKKQSKAIQKHLKDWFKDKQ